LWYLQRGLSERGFEVGEYMKYKNIQNPTPFENHMCPK
jgi:hypothetical protein